MTEVSASEVTGNKLTIGNPMEGHTYKVYQIFKGDVSADGKKLSNISYGANYAGNGEDGTSAVKEADVLEKNAGSLETDAAAKAFAKEVKGKLTGSPAAELTKEAASADLEPGYYLVVDESVSTAAGDAISDYIVGIIGKDVTVQPKAVTVPDFDKSVDDANKGTVTLKDPKPGESWNIAPVEDDDIDDCENAPDNNKFAESVIDKVKDNISDTLTKDHPSTDLEKGWYIIWLEDEDGNIIKADTIRVGSGGVTTYDPEHGASTTIKFTDPGTYDIYQVFSGNVGNNGSITNVSNGANYSGSDTVTSYTGTPDSKVYASNVTLSGDPVVTGTGGSSVNLTQGYYVTKYTGSGGTIYDTLVVGGSGGEITPTPNSTNLIVTDPQDGCTYEVYQVFTGWVHDDFTITNPDYGKNYSGRDNISLTDDVAEFTRVADKKVYGKTVRPYLFGEPYTILNTQDPCITIAPGLYVAISKNSKGEVQEVGAVVADPNKSFSGFNHELDKSDVVLNNNNSNGNAGYGIGSGTDIGNSHVNSGNGLGTLSPTVADEEWDYSLSADGTITLNYYKGGNKDVVVYGNYKVQGSDKIYKTAIKSNTHPYYHNQHYSEYMFSGSSVHSVKFEKDVDTSTCTDMTGMFCNCDNLISVDFGMCNTSNVVRMYMMFFSCDNLTSVDIRSFDTSKAYDMVDMFYSDEKLKSIIVGAKWTTDLAARTQVYIGSGRYQGNNGMFDHCGCGLTYFHYDNEHTFVDTITKEPTCTTDGEMTTSCICGLKHTTVIPASHDYEIKMNNHIELTDMKWETTTSSSSTSPKWSLTSEGTWHINMGLNDAYNVFPSKTWTIDVAEDCIAPVMLDVRADKTYQYTYLLDGKACMVVINDIGFSTRGTAYLHLSPGKHQFSIKSTYTGRPQDKCTRTLDLSFGQPYKLGNICDNGGSVQKTCRRCGDSSTVERCAGDGHEYVSQICKLPVAKWNKINNTNSNYWTNAINEDGYLWQNTTGYSAYSDKDAAQWETYLPASEYLPENVSYTCIQKASASANETTTTLELKPGPLTYAIKSGAVDNRVSLPPIYKEVEVEACKYCGKLKDHYYVKYIHPATCTEDGYTECICAECGDSYKTDIVPALGHEFHDHICTRCGEFEGEIGTYSNLYANWNYTLDQESNRVILNYYKGQIDADNVIIYGAYKVGEITYRTALKQSTNTGSSYTYMFHATQKYNSITVYPRIKSITFNPWIDMSSVTSISGMFANCTYLTQVDMGNLDTSNVIDMNNLFSSCSALESINLSQMDMRNVTNMKAMFSHCTKLKTATFGDSLNLQNAEDMTELFDYCSALDTIDMSHVKTGKLKNITCMFRYCSVLTECNLSGLNVDSVTNINSLFMGDRMLTEVNLDGWNTENVTSMASMFYGCSSLSDIVINEKWTMQNVTNRGNMFYQCTSLLLSEKQKLDPDYSESSSALLPLSIFSHALASESEDTATPAAIEIRGDDKAVGYAANDAVPFKLEATMPESITAYEKYKLVFHDSISQGLSYNQDSLRVLVNGTEIPKETESTDEEGNPVTVQNYKVSFDGDKLTVIMNDVKADPYNAVAGAKITVKYTATLLDTNANLGVNGAYLEYSNNPNGEEMGRTDDDVVEVYSFAVKFDKVNKDKQVLEGAGFTLYKKEANGNYVLAEEIRDEDVNDETASFNFNGLKPGDYKLSETTTPDGYNTMDDLFFTIEAVKSESEDGESVVTVRLLDSKGQVLEGWSVDDSDHSFTSKIVNFSGSELPSTGGMGTYLFYIAGAALVILIGAVMVSRKENKENE